MLKTFSLPKKFEWVLLVIPMIAVYSATSVCKLNKNSGVNVKFRPPSKFFGIIWPILLTLLGVSWIASSRVNNLNSIFYALLVLSLISWVFIYECENKKKEGAWILAISIMFSLMAMIVGNTTSRLTRVPVAIWILFALIMNTTEVQWNIKNV